jgi:hypothetical protein
MKTEVKWGIFGLRSVCDAAPCAWVVGTEPHTWTDNICPRCGEETKKLVVRRKMVYQSTYFYRVVECVGYETKDGKYVDVPLLEGRKK